MEELSGYWVLAFEGYAPLPGPSYNPYPFCRYEMNFIFYLKFPHCYFLFPHARSSGFSRTQTTVPKAMSQNKYFNFKDILSGILLKITKTLFHTSPNPHLSLPEAGSFFLQVLLSSQVLLPQRDRCDFLILTGKSQGKNVPAVLPLGRTNLMSNLHSYSSSLRSMVPTAYTHTVAVFLLWLTFSAPRLFSIYSKDVLALRNLF